MPAKLDYRWNLRQVMATRGMFATTDLIPPLAARNIRLSPSQVYRLVVERPERLSLKVLMALLDILKCEMGDLIEPVAAISTAKKSKAVGGSDAGSGRFARDGPASPKPLNRWTPTRWTASRRGSPRTRGRGRRAGRCPRAEPFACGGGRDHHDPRQRPRPPNVVSRRRSPSGRDCSPTVARLHSGWWAIC